MSLDDQLVAACSGSKPQWDAIERLLRAGANPNAADKESKLPCLWNLIYAERTAEAAKFVRFCASKEHTGRKLNLEARDDDGEGTTYLAFACFEGEDELARALIEAGAELEARDNGFTPLALAAYTGRLPTVRLLLQRGANPLAKHAQSQESVLTLAVHNGHKDVAAALVDRFGVEGLMGEREFVVEFLVKEGIITVG
ncbi:ankyrin repeat-containing domain protein [Hyaloraphidium curvatum]|nr:ankyrin repeat-containing domain protein [Hyaloraphidium curvatum]